MDMWWVGKTAEELWLFFFLFFVSLSLSLSDPLNPEDRGRRKEQLSV